MYIPDDIWNYLKTFIFKTKEMKKYDVFISDLESKIKNIQTIQGRGVNSPEDWMFIHWSLKKQICFIDQYSWHLTKI